MTRARDVMTGSLITCSRDDSVADAARLMRDRNTGDVLVTDNDKLHGIVTDRDVAIRVSARGLDPSLVRVRDVMSKHVVTGQPTWSLDKIAEVMGKNQIRRLPIVNNGMLVGIISLGDLALKEGNSSKLAKSLKHISEPNVFHRRHSRGSSRLLAMLGLGLIAGAVIALTMNPKPVSGLMDDLRDIPIKKWLANLQDSEMFDQIMTTVAQGREMLADNIKI